MVHDNKNNGASVLITKREAVKQAENRTELEILN